MCVPLQHPPHFLEAALSPWPVSLLLILVFSSLPFLHCSFCPFASSAEIMDTFGFKTLLFFHHAHLRGSGSHALFLVHYHSVRVPIGSGPLLSPSGAQEHVAPWAPLLAYMGWSSSVPMKSLFHRKHLLTLFICIYCLFFMPLPSRHSICGHVPSALRISFNVYWWKFPLWS